MSTELQVCTDWLNAFPHLSRFKNGRKLLRVWGPVIFGIELEKFSSEAYRPRFVAMNLLSSFPEFAVSRTLSSKRRPQLSVKYAVHSGNCLEAIDIMKSSFPILENDGDTNQGLLISVYKSEVDSILEESASPLAVWFSLIQLLTYFGDTSSALVERDRLDVYVKQLSAASLVIFGDFPSFLTRELDVSVSEFEKRIKSNVAKGKWSSLPGF